MDLSDSEQEGLSQVPHAWIDFSSAPAATEGRARSRTGALQHIKRDLAGHRLTFPRFELVWARYQELSTGQLFEPARASHGEFETLLTAIEKLEGAVGNGVGLVRLLARQGAQWFREWRDGKLAPEGIEEWEHPYQAAEAMAKALAADISKNVERDADKYDCRWPVLFLDSLEWLDVENEEEALTVEAVQQLCRHLPEVPIIIGSRPELNWTTWEVGGRPIENIETGLIPEDRREEYLASRGVALESREAILDVSGGHALWMGIAVDIALDIQDRENRAASRGDLQAPDRDREELLGRLLERLSGEAEMLEIVDAACVCQWFDRALLRAISGEPAGFSRRFGKLPELSFVQPVQADQAGRPNRWRIHQTVRELVLAQMREDGDLEGPARRGAEYCEVQGERDGDGWEAERVYFLMIVQPGEGLNYGRDLFVRVSLEWDRELGEAVLEASRDAWRAGHVGETQRAREPWQFADWQGYLLAMEGNAPTALSVYESALKAAQLAADRRGEAEVLRGTANLHQNQGRYEDGLRLYEQSLEICRETGDQRGEAQALNGIGVSHDMQDQDDEAMRFYEQALTMFREVGERRLEAKVLNNIAAVHCDQGRYAEALELLEESLSIRREVGDRRGEGTLLNNIGEVYHAQGRYDDAREFYNQAFALRRELDDRHGKGVTLGNLGRLAKDRGDLTKAREYLEEALEALEGLGVPEEAEVRELLDELQDAE